jgi:hypothetical protein
MTDVRQKALALALGLFVSAALAAVALLLSPALRHQLKSRVITADGVGIWQTDAVYGFRHVPGVAGRHAKPESFDVTYTIDASGNRVTPDPEAAVGRVLTLGGSFTFGHGVEDFESWPWLLGKAWSDVKVVNLAVMGWGTGHALLSLEAELNHSQPLLVLYGWIPRHKARNYVRASWVRILTYYGRLHPHFELIENGLERRGVVDLSGSVPDDAPDLDAVERRLTAAMLTRMERLCREAGAPFAVLRLAPSEDDWLLARSGLRVIDLSDVAGGTLPFDGHPSRLWHANVAQRLTSELTPVLSRSRDAMRRRRVPSRGVHAARPSRGARM